jgi:hypothetical protein
MRLAARLALAALFAALASSAAYAQPEVRCESRNYQYQFCSTNGEVVGARITHQDSRSPCIQGQTWGWSRNGLWVSNGCSGRFQVDTFRPGPPSWGGNTLTCNSRGFNYEFCPVPARVYSAELLRQSSQTQCLLGRNWGWRDDGVWVNNGCQGEFRVRTQFQPTPPVRPGLFACESHGFRYQFCNTGPIRNAQLVEQRSRAPCERNRTWGSTGDGVWVDGGCSALFRLTPRW